MFASDKTLADSLFVLQLGCALLFGASQITHMFAITEGVSLTWFAFWEIFLVINLMLSVNAHRNQPSRVTFQTIVVYAFWTVIAAFCLGLLLWQGTAVWNSRDTLTTAVTGVGIAMVAGYGRRQRLTLADPMVRGYLAVLFKGVPQLTLAYNIALVGGDGIAPLGVIAGHVTICTRLGQLWFSIREAGWDRNRIGSLVSEVANEGSWIVATVAWLLV